MFLILYNYVKVNSIFLPLFFSNIIVNCFASMNNYTQLHKGQDLPACPLLGVFVIYIVTIFYFLLNCSYLFAVHIIWCCLNKCDCGGDKPLFNLVWRYTDATKHLWRNRTLFDIYCMLYWSAVGCFTAGLHLVDFDILLQP